MTRENRDKATLHLVRTVGYLVGATEMKLSHEIRDLEFQKVVHQKEIKMIDMKLKELESALKPISEIYGQDKKDKKDEKTKDEQA